MTAEEIKALDAITAKFAHELGEFERTHGTINGGFVTGLFRKLASEYSKEQWNAAIDAALYSGDHFGLGEDVYLDKNTVEKLKKP